MAKFINEHLAIGKGTVIAFRNIPAQSKQTAPSKVKVDAKDKQSNAISWGANNDRPQKVMEEIKLNGTFKAGLRFRKNAHYGNGLVLFRTTYENGKKKITPIDVSKEPAIVDFFRESQMPKFHKEIIADLETFYIGFPEYILSADFNKVKQVHRQRAAWCRYEEMQDNNLIEKIFVSQKWGTETVSKDSKYVKPIPHIDPYWSVETVKEYCKANNITNFIRPCFFPMIEEGYYPNADHYTVVDNGWLSVANSIPTYKKAMFENQISIKYLVEIDERYFLQVYSEDWQDFNTEERRTKRQELIDTIDEQLGGNENAGKSIQSMRIDVGDDKTVPAITITPIDDKFKDGAYLPEASAANSEILFSMNVDPTLIGAGIPGGKLGAGSGSDKREAFLIASALFKTPRETTLEVFNFVRDYNGWDPTINADFENTILTTLDANPTGSQNTVA